MPHSSSMSAAARKSIQEASEALDLDERIDLVTALWETIRADEERVPVDPAHVAIVEDRLREHEEDPSSAEAWSVVRDRISQKLR